MIKENKKNIIKEIVDNLKILIKGWHFFLLMSVIYLGLFIFFPSFFNKCFIFFKQTFLNILPIFLIIFVLMIFTNRYVDSKFVMRHMRGSKIKSWLYALIGGILSTGPVYMWYPLLKDLKENGVSNGEIACFLYSRAIKPALLPLLILYFGLKYAIVLTLVMIFLSLLQGVLITYLTKEKIEFF